MRRIVCSVTPLENEQYMYEDIPTFEDNYVLLTDEGKQVADLLDEFAGLWYIANSTRGNNEMGGLRLYTPTDAHAAAVEFMSILKSHGLSHTVIDVTPFWSTDKLGDGRVCRICVRLKRRFSSPEVR